MTVTPGSRTSKRLRESAQKIKTTPTKSKYFQGSDSEDSEGADSRGDGEDHSGYEDEEASVNQETSSSEPDTEDEDEDDSDGDRRRSASKKKANRQAGAGAASGAKAVFSAVLEKGKELWRPGVKTGLGPGKQVFIEKPKPRGDGGITYVPENIHPNTMTFLRDLKDNNDREWLKSQYCYCCNVGLSFNLPARRLDLDTRSLRDVDGPLSLTPFIVHDPDYRQSWKDWESFVQTLTEKISEIDETIPELPPKDLVRAGRTPSLTPANGGM